MNGQGWPIWQYVESEMDKRNLDARTVLSSLPILGDRRRLGRRYGLVSVDLMAGPRDDMPTALTMAGVHRTLPGPRPYEQSFVKLVQVLADRRSSPA
jgi:hypothetical protein